MSGEVQASPRRSVVVGTAGHIDHGKTTLLRALTGIDADRLPEERRRGMTIDVGYAHLDLADGSVVDFVDVPGHDGLVGNMLVGAGEIDAALLVVAADDGPNAQTLEHLELLDALGIADGLAVVTKSDLAPSPERRATLVAEVEALLSSTTLAGRPVLVASATTGDGIGDVRAAIAALARRVALRLAAAGQPRLAIDRVFAMRGRGTVVTGSLRGGRVTPGMSLRLLPDDVEVRVREVQVRGTTVAAGDGGRTALLAGGVDAAQLRRGQVLTRDPSVTTTSRVLAAIRLPASFPARGHDAVDKVPGDRVRLQVHLGTDRTGALVIRGPREAIELSGGSSIAILRLDAPMAAAPGDRFALRSPSAGSTAGGGVVLDPAPPRGISRRRLTPDRAEALAVSPAGSLAARIDLHGALRETDGWRLAGDVEAALAARARETVAAHHLADPASPGLVIGSLRSAVALEARRRITLRRADADDVARQVVDGLIAGGALAREEDRVRDASRPSGLPPATLAAMDRLEAALSVPAPPSLAEAARTAGCPAEGLRALEAGSRIIRVDDDLAWSSVTYRDLAKQALTMAATGPLSPAALRDATGTSRRYVLALLEDLDRRGLLRRTDTGHVLGPRTLDRLRARAVAASTPPEPRDPDAATDGGDR